MMRDKKNAANTVQYWKCQDHACRGCASSAILDDGIVSLELEEHKPHTSCEPNPALVSKKKRIQQLKKMAIDNPTAPASQLIERLKKPLTIVEKMSLPSNHGLEMHVNRARKPEGVSIDSSGTSGQYRLARYFHENRAERQLPLLRFAPERARKAFHHHFCFFCFLLVFNNQFQLQFPLLIKV
jgi:hypothetical protein